MPDHPILPCGYNADENNGDEVDGAGTNWTIWSVIFDTFQGLVPLVVTDEMLAVFDEACADLTMRHPDDTMVPPAAERIFEVQSHGWRTIMISAEGNVITIRHTPRDKVIRDDWGEDAPPAQGDQVLPRVGPNVVKLRKRQ